MSIATYGTLDIPSDYIRVISGGTIDVSLAFDQSVGIVGGMDTSDTEATATEGEVEHLRTSADAAELFGETSELYHQCRLALMNGATDIYAVAPTETETTEEVTTVAEGTLNDNPILDPTVHPDHEITVQDVDGARDMDVVITYDTPTQPNTSGEFEINPITGDWAADESSSYDITYTRGNYTAAVREVASRHPRSIAICSESERYGNEIITELETNSTDFKFSHAFIGGTPDLDPMEDTHSYDNQRLSVISTSRGYVDDALSEEVRTVGAIAGHFSAQPLGDSVTYDNVDGFVGLRNEWTVPEASALIDNNYMPLMQLDGHKIIKDMTTASNSTVDRVYVVEIVDEITELSHQINQQFIGEVNSEPNRDNLEESHDTMLSELKRQRPPLVDDYTVNARVSDSDNNVVKLELGVMPVGVIDTIDVSLIVGDVITNEGTN